MFWNCIHEEIQENKCDDVLITCTSFVFSIAIKFEKLEKSLNIFQNLNELGCSQRILIVYGCWVEAWTQVWQNLISLSWIKGWV
jgi:hypothetical protein